MYFRGLYSATIDHKSLCMSVRKMWPTFWFKSVASFFVFSLDDLSIAESAVLVYPTLLATQCITAFRSANICLTYLGAPMLCICMRVFVCVFSDKHYNSNSSNRNEDIFRCAFNIYFVCLTKY